MTMHHIQSQSTNNNSTTQITFSSIPQTFTHLQLRVTSSIYAASGSGGSAFYLGNVNGSSPTKHHQMYGDGNGHIASSDANMPIGYNQYNSSPTWYGGTIIDFFDYSNTSKTKTIKSLSGWDASGSGVVGIHSILVNNTAAISSFILGSGGGFFATGSRFDLYGITTNPIATGA